MPKLPPSRNRERIPTALYVQVKSEGDFSLSVDSSEQVWLLGACPDFGYCKANKKVSQGWGKDSHWSVMG